MIYCSTTGSRLGVEYTCILETIMQQQLVLRLGIILGFDLMTAYYFTVQSVLIPHTIGSKARNMRCHFN